MSCIIKYKGKKYSEEQFKEYFINNKQEFATSIAKNKDVIDSFKRKMEGIDFVFSQSPELASVGSKAQYLQYLSTIFPNSKVKDIVYHGSDVENLQQFNLKYFGQKDVGDRGYGIYLSKDKNVARGYGKYLYNVLVNIQNPYNVKFKDNDPSYLWNRIEHNSYKQDIEKLEKDRNKWIEKVNNNDIGYAFFEELPKNANKEVQLKFVNDRINKQISDKQERLNELVIINNSDGVINEDYEIVTKPEQIHILSSKADIQGFKEFVDKNNINQDLQNLNLTISVLESLYENSSKLKDFITFVKDLKKMIAIWQNSGRTNEEILEMIKCL